MRMIAVMLALVLSGSGWLHAAEKLAGGKAELEQKELEQKKEVARAGDRAHHSDLGKVTVDVRIAKDDPEQIYAWRKEVRKDTETLEAWLISAATDKFMRSGDHESGAYVTFVPRAGDRPSRLELQCGTAAARLAALKLLEGFSGDGYGIHQLIRHQDESEHNLTFDVVLQVQSRVTFSRRVPSQEVQRRSLWYDGYDDDFREPAVPRKENRRTY